MWWLPLQILGVIVQTILLVHASFDAACTLCCLFPRVFPLTYLASAYSSAYGDALNREHAALGRALVYWASAMSLVRVVALLLFQNDALLVCVAIMYLLEGLVAEYEGFTTGAISQETARIISRFSFGVCWLLAVFGTLGWLV